MKKNSPLILLFLLAVTSMMFLISGCSKDSLQKNKTYTYTILSPVYKAKASVLAGINGSASQSIEHAGKIYIKDNFIFLNETDKGIHIINNSNPAHPVQVAFLSIPGNQDIAVKGNILYADMYNDLLAIDITNPTHVNTSSQLRNLFTERGYVNGVLTNTEQEVVTDWIKKDTTVTVDESINPYPECLGCNFDLAPAGSTKSASGVAGSMAGMVMIGDYMYAITERHSLGVINLSNASVPKFESSMFAGFDLQTIYPFENKLFLGSAIGMFIYDVSDPVHPTALGQFSHGRACDPVITDGSYAYVTLHAGTECGGDDNELNVINVQNLLQAELVKSYPLTKPTGLCKDGNLLFVCDSSEVKVYDAANPADLKLLQQIKSNEPYDIIASNKKALVVANDGLYQYDYSDLLHIRLLSFLATKK